MAYHVSDSQRGVRRGQNVVTLSRVCALQICLSLIFLSGCFSTPLGGEVFRGEWFDYYNRGMHRLRSGDTESAEGDLRRALAQRPGDFDSVRTYGVHFQSYYPHRELGILALERGDWEDALRELESSYQKAPTSRGIHFLNEARRMKIIRSDLDHSDPVVAIELTAGKTLTNQRHFQVKGTVEDDTYVAWISVNDEPVFFELSEPKRSFDEIVSLVPGKNIITVSANDLGGRSSEKSIEVELDIQGPSLSLDETRVVAGAEGRRLWIKGAAFDQNGIAEFRIAEKSLGQSDRIDLAEWFPVESDQDSVDYFLKDLCGNETRGKIHLDGVAQGTDQGRLPEYLREPVQMGLLHQTPLLLAGLNPTIPSWARIAAVDRGPATFDFGRLSTLNRVYRRDFFINGSVYDADGIAKLNLDGEDYPFISGKEVHFSHFADLQSGTNTLRFVAENGKGVITSSTLVLVLEQPACRQVASRLKLASYGFAAEGNITPATREMTRRLLESKVAEQARFNLLERELLDKILLEHKIAELSEQQWPTLTKLTPADVLLFGKIIEWREGYDIFLKIVNAKTPDVPINEIKIYQPRGVGMDGLYRNIKGLYYLLENEFPLVAGKVVRCDAARIITNLSHAHRIRPGFDLIVYRRGEPIIEDGIDYGCQEDDLGMATVEKVLEQVSYAVTEHECGVKTGDFVITR
ncbi:MAG TPA: CsgG/HfaB family protein [bacterium]|nr:CsgG/HfaB family protein [bacterium]